MINPNLCISSEKYVSFFIEKFFCFLNRTFLLFPFCWKTIFFYWNVEEKFNSFKKVSDLNNKRKIITSEMVCRKQIYYEFFNLKKNV